MPAMESQTSLRSWKETPIQLMSRWQYRKHVKSLAMQRPSPDPNPASQVDRQQVKSLALPASCAHQDDDKTGNQSVPRRPKKLSALDGFQPQRRRAKQLSISILRRANTSGCAGAVRTAWCGNQRSSKPGQSRPRVTRAPCRT